MTQGTRAAKKPRWIRRTEIFFFSVGGLLLTFAGGAMLLGRIQKDRALLRFHEALAAPLSPDSAASTGRKTAMDTSTWSPERLKAFLESQRVATGEPLAVLHVPKVGIEVPVFDGTDELTLNRGVGLIEGTARLGQHGNVGIAGHRDGFFRPLMHVQPNDIMEVETRSGKTRYKIVSIKIVTPEDVSVLDATSEPTLTLVTCYPFYFVGSAPQRYIVRAVAETTNSPAK